MANLTTLVTIEPDVADTADCDPYFALGQEGEVASSHALAISPRRCIPDSARSR